jgi:hypothetical protein
MGDFKCLEDSVRSAGDICGSVSVEEEIAIPEVKLAPLISLFNVASTIPAAAPS